MKHDLMFKKTGLCASCGKDTQLLIHAGCGDKLQKNKERKVKKKLSKQSIDYLSKTYG